MDDEMVPLWMQGYSRERMMLIHICLLRDLEVDFLAFEGMLEAPVLSVLEVDALVAVDYFEGLNIVVLAASKLEEQTIVVHATVEWEDVREALEEN